MTEGSDVDLEDGELMSSDEEGDSGVKKELPVEEVETTKSSPKPTTSEQTHETSLATQSSIEPVSDDGEIYSDNEESAYFPQQVKSRPPPKRRTQNLPQRKRVSRWSDAYTSSPTRPQGQENNNRSHSPEKSRKNTHSDSPDQETCFEEHDNSNDRRSSRDRKRRRSSPIRRRDSPNRSGDRHSSPESRRSYNNHDRNQDRNSPGPQRQKWSHRGGYGSSSPYQSKGHSRYGRGRGGGGNKRFQNVPAKEYRFLSQQVPQRLREGLSLLPDPKYGRSTRVDLSMYPPPATWYLRELKAWDALHKAKKLTATIQQQTSTDPSLPVPTFTASVSSSSFQPTSMISLLAPMAPLPVPLMSSLVNIDTADSKPTHPPIVSYVNTDARNEHTNYDVDTTPPPLDPSMPFAQPMPSSSNIPFAQPLISSFQTQPPLTTIDSLSEQTSQPEQTNHDSAKEFIVPGFSNELKEPQIETESATLDVSNVTVSDVDSSFLGRTVSVSSEVAMEIDWKTDSQCGTPGLPTPSSPIFTPPKPITPTLPSTPTQPHSSHTPTEDAPHPESNTTSQAPEIPLHSTDDETHQNPASSHSTFVTSSPSLMSPCNSQEEAEPIMYNLRSKPAPDTMDLVEKRKYHRNVMEVIDVSDEEIDYDSYLDQLDDDEVPISATITSSLALSSLLQDSLPKLGGEELDPFSEDFPVINRASAPEISSGGGSLMALVGAEAVKEPEAVRKQPGLKSSKRKEKELTWKARQRQRQLAAKEAPPLQKPPRPQCKYFMNGICKNGDNCTFSHDGPRTKKKEVCKFYKLDTCNKGQDCMYYHGEFPCMFYHLKQYCRNGENCKFSHAPLNADTEALLATVVDCVTPTATTPTPHPLMANERMLINEDGIQVNMFGQSEGFVASMPKEATTEEMTVSIPLTKVKIKTKLGRIPKKSTAPATSMAPPSWNSNTPAPLFPGTSLGNHTKGEAQNPPKRVLLPTPPLHVKLTPEDFKRMENMPHEYWEAPHLSETHPQPHPPGIPERRPSIEPSYRPPPPFPPRQRQPFYRPPVPPPRPAPPEQSWNQPPPHQWPGKMESGPPNSNRPPPDVHVGPGVWNQNAPPRPDQNASGGYPRPAPRPSGMDSRLSGMDPRPSGMDSRPSGMDSRPSGMNPRHTGNDPRHSTINNPSDPRNSSSQPYQGPGAKWGQSTNIGKMQSSPPYAGQHGMSPPLSTDKRGWSDKMSPNWKKPDRVSPAWGTNPDPRYSSNDPRFSAHSDPRNSPSQPYQGPGAKWGQSTNIGKMQSSPPYAGQHGMSPPLSTDKRGQLDKMSPNWKPASWGTSPDHQSSTGKGVGDATKRLDPRKKYSHLKIKSKNSPNESSTEPTSEPSYKIPRLLSDSTGLEKPIDPKELFGSDGGMESQPYGEITFGTYKSPFTQNTKINENTPSETAASINNKTISNTHTTTDEMKSTGQEVAVPSYFAQIESELGGGGLEIESAFSSLSEKSKEEESKGQESQARKLPSVFGFGL